jgi:hypothetical protein
VKCAFCRSVIEDREKSTCFSSVELVREFGLR